MYYPHNIFPVFSFPHDVIDSTTPHAMKIMAANCLFEG